MTRSSARCGRPRCTVTALWQVDPPIPMFAQTTFVESFAGMESTTVSLRTISTLLPLSSDHAAWCLMVPPQPITPYRHHPLPLPTAATDTATSTTYHVPTYLQYHQHHHPPPPTVAYHYLPSPPCILTMLRGVARPAAVLGGALHDGNQTTLEDPRTVLRWHMRSEEEDEKVEVEK